jgi:hypothetical protein
MYKFGKPCFIHACPSLGSLETAQSEDVSHNLTDGKTLLRVSHGHPFLTEIIRSSDCRTRHLAELSGLYFEPFCSLSRAASILSGVADAAFGQAITTSR